MISQPARMRALHYGQPDRRHLEPGDHSCHFCNANDTRSRLLDVEGASYQGYFAATPVKIMGQLGPDVPIPLSGPKLLTELATV